MMADDSEATVHFVVHGCVCAVQSVSVVFCTAHEIDNDMKTQL